jgi:lipoprotein-anchoring transpeptidase ErfK/SrfK
VSFIRARPEPCFTAASHVTNLRPSRMTFRPTLRALLGACIIPALPGCALFAPKPPPPPPPPPQPKPAYVWDDTKAKMINDPAAVVIDLSEQRVYFYKGEELIGESKCSSGKKGFETPPGTYKITQKNKDHVSNLYGNFVDLEGTVMQRDVDTSKMKVPEGMTFAGAKMPYFQRFTGGFGLHAGNVPNRRASHGCVRLPRIMAERFFAHTTVGTPVTVQD